MQFPKRRIVFLFVLSILIIATAAYAAGGKLMRKTEAQAQISKLIPGIEVLSVSKTPVKGIFEIVFVDANGRKNIAYLSSDKRHLIAGPLFDIDKQINLTKVKFDSINKVDFASIPLEHDLVLGNPKAKHKVVIFDDPD